MIQPTVILLISALFRLVLSENIWQNEKPLFWCPFPNINRYFTKFFVPNCTVC